MKPRTPADHTLRQLGAPRRVSVEPDERGHPRAVFRERAQRWIRVASIQDRWRIDDCWWQVEYGGGISRMYYAVELAGGQLMTVYRDLLTGLWYEQRDTAPTHGASAIDVLAPRGQHGAAGREALNRPPASLRGTAR